MKFKRGIAAFIAAMMVCGCTVFGAEQTQAEVVRVIAYEEAVELAIKNNNSLKTLADNLDTLEKQNEKLWDALGLQIIQESQNTPIYLPGSTVSVFTSINTIESSMKNIKYSKEMTEDGCELVVKNYMTAIVNGEKSVEMLKDSFDMVSKNTQFNRIKYDLGMLSETEYKEALNDYTEAKYTLELAEFNLETAYNNLSDIIGLRNGEKFVVEYNVDYEQYPVEADLNAWANSKISNDPMLKIAQNSVDDAEFQMDYVAIDNGTDYDTRDKNLSAAGRDYNDTKNSLILALKNGYITVKQAEINIENKKIALEEAQTAYNNAVLSRQVGYITDTELQGAGIALKKAEADLESAILNHDIAKFMLDRPYMLAQSNSTSK